MQPASPKYLKLAMGAQSDVLPRFPSPSDPSAALKPTPSHLDIPNLVHGTRQVVHLVQKGPELSQGHL